MIRSRSTVARLVRTGLVCSACLTVAGLLGAGTGSITKLSLNPDAAVVELFSGLESGQLDVRMVALNAHEGKVFFTNQTDKPLTVAIPKAIVGVHVLPQFGNQGPAGLVGANANNNQANNGSNGQAQGVGGIFGAVGNNNGLPNAPGGLQNQFPGNNFFSIPPEKTVQLALRSVCLNHGRPDPNAGMKYQITKVESYTTDPVLQQLLNDYSVRTSKEAQQAAVWHVANGLSWKKLANLTQQRIPGVAVPLFTKTQIDSARELVERAEQRSTEEATKRKGAVAPELATTQN